MKIKLYMIYGVLGHEKETVYREYGVTPENPYDVIEADLPGGWSLAKNSVGETLVGEPSGECTPLALCLTSLKSGPAIWSTNEDGSTTRIPLKWHYANNALRELREGRGWTLKTLSEKTGLQIRALQKIELGEVNIENITAKNLLLIADALGVAPYALFK